MSKTLEETALQVAREVKGTQGDLNIQIVEFARRLVEALGAQEPECYYYEHKTGCEDPQISFSIWPNSHENWEETKLYAAPYIKEGWQMVPKEPDLNMVIAGENCIGRHAYAKMLAAAPEYGK